MLVEEEKIKLLFKRKLFNLKSLFLWNLERLKTKVEKETKMNRYFEKKEFTWLSFKFHLVQSCKAPSFFQIISLKLLNIC
jgi:hypothetical protein